LNKFQKRNEVVPEISARTIPPHALHSMIVISKDG